MPNSCSEVGSQRRVLVVDDEFHVRSTVAKLLEKRDYCVEEFDNATDALEAIRQRGCDLLLTDVKMPGMNGVELLRQACEVDPEMPVILMSAYADLDMAVNAVKLGAFDFIIKPFEPECLLSAIDKGFKYRYLCRFEKEYKKELESAVVEKTRELQDLHSQFILSEKMAAIGLLSAGIAHEINNPLSFIASNLASLSKYIDRLSAFTGKLEELVKSNCDQEQLAELEQYKRTRKIGYVMKDIGQMVEESSEGVDRIRKIVTSLKTFSRKDENVLTDANLNDLIESTLTIVWNEIKYVATLTKELGDIPTIKCYPSQLNQVIMNLLVNAAHAIDQGPGIITVRTWADENVVFLEVGDTGCGISAENLDKIFAPFFTTKEAGKGTGLGLSICYEIVARHKGEIRVASQLGKGTSFTVSLPIQPA